VPGHVPKRVERAFCQTLLCQDEVSCGCARSWKRQGADSDSADMLDTALGGGGGRGGVHHTGQQPHTCQDLSSPTLHVAI